MKLRYAPLVMMVVAACSTSEKRPPAKQDSTPRAPSRTVFKDSGTSSMELLRDTLNGFPEIGMIERNQTYHILEFPEFHIGVMAITRALLSELSEQRSNAVPSETEGKILLAARVVPPDQGADFRPVTWRDTIIANRIRYGEEFIEASSFRYQGPSPCRSLYRYQDGAHLLTFTSDFFGLEEVKDYSERRYIGFWEASERSPGELGFDTSHDVFGILTYVDPISLHAQHLVLKLNTWPLAERPDWEHCTAITITGLKPSAGDHYSEHLDATQHHEHWGYSDFRHLDIKLTLKGTVPITLHIPVRDDTLDASHLKSDWFDVELHASEAR